MKNPIFELNRLSKGSSYSRERSNMIATPFTALQSRSHS